MNITEIAIPREQDEEVLGAVISQDLHYVGTMIKDQPGAIWQAFDRKKIALPVTEPISNLAFRPKKEGQTTEVAIAVGDLSSGVSRFDLDLVKLEVGLMGMFLPRAHCVAYSHEGTFLAAGTSTGTVAVWFLGDRPVEVQSRKVGHGQCVTSLAFGPKNDHLFVTLASGETWDFNPLDAKSPLARTITCRIDGRYNGKYYCVATQPQLVEAAFAGEGDWVALYNPVTRRVTEFHTGAGDFIRSVEFLPNQQLAVIGTNGLKVWLVDPQKKRSLMDERGNEPGKKQFVCSRYCGDLLLAAYV